MTNQFSPLSDTFRQAAQHNVQSWMASNRPQKDLAPEPTDTMEMRKETPPEGTPQQAPAPPPSANAAKAAVEAAAREQPAAPPQEENSEALEERLLHDMPPEILNTARTMMKGQIDRKKGPSRSLANMQTPDGLGCIKEPLGYRSVLDDIVEDGGPLAPELDYSY